MCTRSMMALDLVPSLCPRMFLFLKKTMRVFTRRAWQRPWRLLLHCAVRSRSSISGKPSMQAARRWFAGMAEGSHKAMSSRLGLEFHIAVGLCPRLVWICNRPGMYTRRTVSQFCNLSLRILRRSRSAVVWSILGIFDCSIANVFSCRLCAR